jgi:hypothetical protein
MWNEAVVIYLKVQSLHLPGGTGKTMNTLLGQPVSVLTFEPKASRIRSRCVDHSTAKFSSVYLFHVALNLFLLFFTRSLLFLILYFHLCCSVVPCLVSDGGVKMTRCSGNADLCIVKKCYALG